MHLSSLLLLATGACLASAGVIPLNSVDNYIDTTTQESLEASTQVYISSTTTAADAVAVLSGLSDEQVDKAYEMFSVLKNSWKDQKAATEYFAKECEGFPEDKKAKFMDDVAAAIEFVQWTRQRAQKLSPKVYNALSNMLESLSSKAFFKADPEQKSTMIMSNMSVMFTFNRAELTEFSQFTEEFKGKLETLVKVLQEMQ